MSGIIGTAGHIDHGKTSLVRALTGVDCDRLPEEKRRGITIQLGFAELDLGDGRTAGVVDVPGHERFVRTMVAGATGIDVALFVVAADEGMMPQSREHLEICGWLGIERGVIALTKIDKAGPELTELAAEDVAEAVQGSFLEGAPVVRCSARTGEGIDALRAVLAQRLFARPEADGDGPLFMPVDRVFTVKGFGTVITGTAAAGRAETGDLLEVLPGGPGRRAEGRVRSVESFGRSEATVRPGRRTAVALAGLDPQDVRPGNVLAPPGVLRPTRRLSVHLSCSPSRGGALKTGARLALHLGTSSLPGVGLTLLSTERLAPGQSDFATLRAPAPVVARPGQRFVLRGDDAPGRAGRTVGGGVVLDPEPPRRRRKAPAVLARLETLLAGDRAASATALLAEAGPRGLVRDALARRVGAASGDLDRLPGVTRAGDRLVTDAALAEVEPGILAEVERYHAAHLLEPGIRPAELEGRVGPGLPPEVVAAAVERLVAAGALARGPRGALVDPGFRTQRRATMGKSACLERLEEAGLEPPDLPALAAALERTEAETKTYLSALAREGAAVRVGPLVFARSALDRASRLVVDALRAGGALSTADAKTLLGVSRKYLIPLLEHLDKLGVTRREGSTRRLGPRAERPTR